MYCKKKKDSFQVLFQGITHSYNIYLADKYNTGPMNCKTMVLEYYCKKKTEKFCFFVLGKKNYISNISFGTVSVTYLTISLEKENLMRKT